MNTLMAHQEIIALVTNDAERRLEVLARYANKLDAHIAMLEEQQTAVYSKRVDLFTWMEQMEDEVKLLPFNEKEQAAYLMALNDVKVRM